MTHSNPSPQPPRPPRLDGSRDGSRDDPFDEWETRFADALAAPPVPKSLLRRLDQGIESQWGHSPSLAGEPSAKVRWALTAGRNRLRAWPLAAGVAATLVLAFLLTPSGSTGYAWATVLEAIARQPVLQIESGDQLRRFDLSHTAAASQSQRTGLLLAFLLGEPDAHGAPASLQDLRVVEESWTRQGESISLKVRFASNQSDHLALNLTLDPETSLPQAIRWLEGPPATAAALSYPTADERHPAEARIGQSDPVGRDHPGPANPTTRDRRGLSLTTASPEADPSAATSTADAENPNGFSDKNTGDTTASLLLGAATQWRPVAARAHSDDEVINQIDQTLTNLWNRLEIDPVATASDQEMLRRAYLDLAGRTPTVTEVRDFLKDSRPDRYRRLVDRLLESPDHASHLATTWRTFLIPEGVDLTAFGGREAFDRWLAEQFARNEPYDEVVRRLLLAEGRLSKSGPLLFYSALKLDPEQLAARTSRVFLGIRLECAQCHDHPFEPWTQTDFWSYAAFFAQISRPKGELENVSTVMRVQDVDRGDVMLPESDQVIPPRFLSAADRPQQRDAGISEQRDAGISERGESVVRRQKLATWLTGGDNPYFARATVNRIWAQMFGRGIVDPVDDFGMLNPPVSPELLDLLAGQLIGSDFDLRRVFRTIALSRAYRLSSGSDSPDANRLRHFAQMDVKTLTAHQLYDCITVASSLDQSGGPAGTASIARFGNSERELFLQQFASPPGNRVEYLAGIPQALTLMNGGLVGSATGASGGGLLKSLDAPFFTNDQRIEVLFLATLSRPPRPGELEWLREAIPEAATPAERSAGMADILWALLNSAEFTLNH